MPKNVKKIYIQRIVVHLPEFEQITDAADTTRPNRDTTAQVLLEKKIRLHQFFKVIMYAIDL